MHELSLAQSLVEQVGRAAEKENAVRVLRIVVAIGKHSGVERDAFEFAFPFAAGEGVLEGAELVVEEIPATVACRSCGAESHPGIVNLVCMRCGSAEVELVGGREFLVRSVELEVPGG